MKELNLSPKNCPHAEEGWITRSNEIIRFSKEYTKGAYKGVYCYHDEKECSFKNYEDCCIYIKHNGE